MIIINIWSLASNIMNCNRIAYFQIFMESKFHFYVNGLRRHTTKKTTVNDLFSKYFHCCLLHTHKHMLPPSRFFSLVFLFPSLSPAGKYKYILLSHKTGDKDRQAGTVIRGQHGLMGEGNPATLLQKHCRVIPNPYIYNKNITHTHYKCVLGLNVF